MLFLPLKPTLWNKFLPEKLTVRQLVKKSAVFLTLIDSYNITINVTYNYVNISAKLNKVLLLLDTAY